MYRVLSIDGGGIRGILPGMLVSALEKKIQLKTGDENARVADYFDLFAGTSTGGILTLGYLCPDEQDPGKSKFTADEVVDIYLDEGDEIFSVPLMKRIRSLNGTLDEKYPATELEAALEAKFGNVMLSQLRKPCLVSSYDIRRRRPTFFKQHKAAEDNARNFKIRDVARATSAAPTYFEPARILSDTGTRYPLVDGGVIANDPALCAYAEARTLESVGARDMLLVSIGCAPGDNLKRYTYDEAKDWGLAGWVKPIVDITFEGGPQISEYVLNEIFNSVDASHNYHRILPNLLDASPEMDDASTENLKRLKEAGEDNVRTFDGELDAIVEKLVGQ